MSASSDRRAGWVLAAILFLGFVLRVVPLMQSHSWDETVFLQHARILVDGRTNYDEFQHRPPLLPFFYAAGFLVWDHLYAANIVQGAITVLGVAFAYLYARICFDRTSALGAAALLAFAPYLVFASHELLTDAPAVTLMLAAVWAFERPGWRYAVVSGVLYSLAIQTRFTSMFLVVYFALQAILVHRDWRRLLPWGLAAAIAIVPYLVWNYARFGDWVHPFVIARRIVTEWTAPMPAAYYVPALAEILPLSAWALFVAGLASVAARAVRAHRGAVVDATMPARAAANTALRVLVLTVWAIAFFVYMTSIPHKEVRYLLPLVIPAAVIGGYGLAAVVGWFRSKPRLVRIAALAIGVAIGVQEYGASFRKLIEPWREPRLAGAPRAGSALESIRIAAYLREASSSSDTIYATHDFPVLAFYSGRRTVSLLPIQESFDEDWRGLMDRPGLFVLTHPEAIGETHARNPIFKPDRQFVEARGEFRRVREFPGATVYRYEPGD